ncbi:MAG TPA: hypothetical protein VFN85_06280 [Solirubrobacterales bacterium]|nr:hypothetical protein [Solirubrobacterales bacterium]
MVVMPRERWTDERLDKAFGRIDGDLRELRVEMRKGFEQIDKRFEEMDKRFEQVDKRFEQVDKRFDQVFFWLAGLCFTIIGGLGAGIVTALSFG